LYEKLEQEGVYLINEKNEEEDHVEKKNPHMHMSVEEKILLQKSQLRSQTLHQEFELGVEAGNKDLKRVTIEAIDMDWIFYEDNSEKLLNILSDTTNEKVLTKKSIKIFVAFMWKHY